MKQLEQWAREISEESGGCFCDPSGECAGCRCLIAMAEKFRAEVLKLMREEHELAMAAGNGEAVSLAIHNCMCVARNLGLGEVDS